VSHYVDVRHLPERLSWSFALPFLPLTIH